jgi:hypothetical protein
MHFCTISLPILFNFSTNALQFLCQFATNSLPSRKGIRRGNTLARFQSLRGLFTVTEIPFSLDALTRANISETTYLCHERSGKAPL